MKKSHRYVGVFSLVSFRFFVCFVWGVVVGFFLLFFP